MKRYRKKYINKRRQQKHRLVVMAEYFIFVIIVCIIYLCYTTLEAKKNQNLYAVSDTSSNNTVTKNNFSTDTGNIENEQQQLYLSAKQENQEVIGWISIEGTDISYPLLQTIDNSYYLTHNYKNESSQYGSIFLHKNSVLTNEFSNLIIYGHNMNDGSQMFSSLLNYTDKDFFNSHKTIKITTDTKEYVYSIFSVFKSKVYNNDDTNVFRYYSYTDLTDQNKFNEYVSNCKKYQLYNTSSSAVYGNQIITLVTCEYSQDNGRLVVVGKKLKTISLTN